MVLALRLLSTGHQASTLGSGRRMDAEVTQKENRRVTGQLQGTEETTRPNEGLAHRERTHGSAHGRATVRALYTSLSDLWEALPTCLGVQSRCKISRWGTGRWFTQQGVCTPSSAS